MITNDNRAGLISAGNPTQEPLGISGRSIIQQVTSRGKAVTDPTKSGSASDRMGQLIRAEWDDYVTRFQPYDQKVISMATGDEDNLAAVGRARAGVAGSFDVAQGTLQRNKERLGLSDAVDEVAVNNRNTATARTSSELDAINGTRIHAQDRDLSLMAGDAAAGLKSGRLSGA